MTRLEAHAHKQEIEMVRMQLSHATHFINMLIVLKGNADRLVVTSEALRKVENWPVRFELNPELDAIVLTREKFSGKQGLIVEG